MGEVREREGEERGRGGLCEGGGGNEAAVVGGWRGNEAAVGGVRVGEEMRPRWVG